MRTSKKSPRGGKIFREENRTMTEQSVATSVPEVEINETVAKLLLGVSKKTSQLCLEALGLIHRGSSAHQQIFDACLKCAGSAESHYDIAKVVMATTAYNPHHSDKWLKAIRALFSGSEGNELIKRHETITTEVPDQVVSHFAQGIVLGIFQSMLWLDEEWRVTTEFEKELPQVVTDIVLCQNAIAKSIDFHPPFTTPDKAYESQLSQVIKAYVKGREYYKGHRCAQVMDIIDSVYFQLERKKKEKFEPSLFGKMVFDQIAYAVFGSMSTQGRAHALYLLFKDLCSPPSKIES